MTDGLVLALTADEGVVTDGQTATAWQDQTSGGNDLSATGRPALLRSGTPTDMPALRFDGDDDALRRDGTSGLPTGSEDRTVVLVARYRSTGTGGFSYGAPRGNQAFGLVVDRDGLLAIQGWGGSSDFVSETPGTGAGWLTQTAVLNDGRLSHYSDGSEIDVATHTFDTAADEIVLGANPNAPPYTEMDVAAVLVYDRALSDAEREELQQDLDTTYIGSTAEPNQPPNTNGDSASVPVGESVTVDVLANDSDFDGTLDPSSVTVASGAENGTVTVNGTTGVVTYTHDGSTATTDSFTYTVADDDGATSNETTVSMDVTSSNTAPTANDDSASVPQGESVAVDVLANDSDTEGTVDASTVAVVSGPSNGTLTVNETTGAVTYTHDGSTAATDSFTYTVDDDDGATSDEATVSIDVTGIETSEPPTASDDAVALYPGTTVVVDVLANDADPDGTLDQSSLDIVERPSNGTLQVLGNSGRIRYAHGLFAGYEDTLTYRVADDDGNLSNIATVTFEVTKDAPRGRRGVVDPSSTSTIGDDTQTKSLSTTQDTSTASFSTSSNFSAVRILTGYNQPVAFTFLPDGRMILLQKNGEMFIANATESPAVAEPYMTVSNVRTRGEQGLLDIALDPDFGQNGYFYVYYTNDTVDKNRISRFQHVENSGGIESAGDPASEAVVWQNEQTNVSRCCHFGGGLDVGPDGRIYLTTGEQFNGSAAQDLSNANGKIIRVNRDGSIPSTNPFVDDPDALDSIYAYGLRNPYRANFDQPTSRFFIGEVGGNNDSTAYEDINLGESAANYGWPECEGYCDNPDYTDPIYAYPHDGTGASVTVGPLYRGQQFPSTYNETLFYSDYVRGWIKYLTFDSTGDVQTSEDFYSSSDAIVFVGQGPDGSLYYTGIVDGNVYRISYTDNQPPEITEATANTTSGPSPQTVAFTGNATDPDGDALSYTWVFGDGTQASGKDATHTYGSPGSYDAYLEVTDGSNTVTSARITIQVGSPPSVNITAPANESLFRAGETINFVANASDPEDGTLSDSQYDWTLTFLHDEHTHPGFDDVNGDTANYTVPTEGHDYSSDTGYEATVTVTDSDGLTATDSVFVFPDKVNLTFDTEPSGLSFKLDSITRDTPYTHDTAINFTHTIEAPETQCVDGTEYAFQSWSDGGARVHDITVPETDTTYTATYEAVGACDQLVTNGLVLHLESDTGLSTTDGTVASWADQSGQDNDLSAEGDPTLITGATPSGAAAVSFDGTDDALSRSTLNAFPTGNQNRTVFLVTSYQSTGFGGFTWGDVNGNEAFGTTVDDEGVLMIQGWGGPNDYPAGVTGTGAGWLSQSVVLANDQFTHYKDGTQIDAQTHTFNTGTNEAVLGAELNRSPYLDMEVAAVLVYDRALTDTERQQVETYLQDTYLNTSSNTAPTALDDSASVTQGESVDIDVLANDSDSDGTLDASSVTIVTAPSSGSTSVNTTTGVVTYTHDGSTTTTDSFTYTVDDDDGATSNEATVSIDITSSNTTGDLPVTNGLVLHLESDTGLSTTDGTVASWADQSGQDNDLAAEGAPTLLTGATPSGAAAVSFDGTDDTLSRTSLNGFPTGNQNRTVFLVTSYQSVGFGGFAWGDHSPNRAFGTTVDDNGELMLQGWGGPNDYPAGVTGTDAGWLTQSVTLANDQFTHYKDGTQIGTGTHTFDTGTGQAVLGAELDAPPYLDMQVASVLVYDRALTDTERQQVQQYLQDTYLDTTSNTAPTALDDAASVTQGDSVDVDVLANDSDSDGTLDPSSVTIVSQPSNGSVSVNTSTGIVTYTHDGSTTTTDSFTYTVDDDDGATSNEATVSIDVTSSNTAPTANDDSASVPQGESAEVDVLANDSDSDGTLGPSSVTIVTAPSNGSASVNTSTGIVTYTHDGSTTTTDSFTYTVDDDDGATSNEATVSIDVTASGTTDLPVTNGLVLHLESDTGLSTTDGAVTSWADQSGQDNDLSAEGAPTLVTGATPSGAAAVSFDGTDDTLNRTSLNGFPTSNQNRTVFLVTSYQSVGFGGFAWGDHSPNRAFGTTVDDNGELMLQGWGGPNDYPAGVTGTDAGWLTQSVVLANDQFTHYKDGTQIGTGTHTFDTGTGQAVLGAELDAPPYLDMQVAAVLVYDRALTDTERQQVQQYLQDTYLDTSS
ncbi:Ig-like domain-containing protein [Salinirubellus salinus]|uniref:Ig-like domain-containing protein n=1 Tax=Salinirubellus salinus TaxID=1364945 RepID=A0A9E7R275_9EURY|nr:Ig-like domain-containing protein [Salinirubellus salinus]UWM54359.1 Ig-like domain-containing protein [Salinirubellus salinus]